MQIEYTTPQADYLDVAVTLTEPDGSVGAAACVYKPEAVVGLKAIPVGKFTARGASGRVEEAVVLFDLRKSEFVIQPKKLVAGGFDFDKPISLDAGAETTDTAAAAANDPPMQIAFGGKK